MARRRRNSLTDRPHSRARKRRSALRSRVAQQVGQGLGFVVGGHAGASSRSYESDRNGRGRCNAAHAGQRTHRLAPGHGNALLDGQATRSTRRRRPRWTRTTACPPWPLQPLHVPATSAGTIPTRRAICWSIRVPPVPAAGSPRRPSAPSASWGSPRRGDRRPFALPRLPRPSGARLLQQSVQLRLQGPRSPGARPRPAARPRRPQPLPAPRQVRFAA